MNWKWIAAFLTGWAGFGLLTMGIAKATGSPVWGWTIGYLTGVTVSHLDRRFFGRTK